MWQLFINPFIFFINQFVRLLDKNTFASLRPNPTISTNDFAALSEQQISSLLYLLNQFPDRHVFAKGHYDSLILDCTIIKHLSAYKAQSGARFPNTRYEVIEQNAFTSGQFGSLHRVLWTLSKDDPGQLKVKQRKPESLRLVKIQNLIESNKNRLNNILTEAYNLQSYSMFRSKPTVIEGEKAYIIMRHLPGVTLFDLLETETLSNSQRYTLSVALLTAVKEQFHVKNKVHCDLKLENIKIHSNGDQFEVYILDLSTLHDGDNLVFCDFETTPGYVPPEYFDRYINLSTKFDIYSLGKVLMFVWGYRDTEAWLQKNLRQQAQFPAFEETFKYLEEQPACKEELLHLFKKMCSIDPLDRPDVDQVLTAFAGFEDRLEPCSQYEMK